MYFMKFRGEFWQKIPQGLSDRHCVLSLRVLNPLIFIRVICANTFFRPGLPGSGKTKSIGFLKLLVSIAALLWLNCLQLQAKQASGDLFQVMETADNFTLIEFNLNYYEQTSEMIDGISYHRFHHPSAGLLMNEGLPEILTFSTIISIPHRGSIDIDEVTISTSETLKDITLFPSQGFNVEIDEEKGFRKDADLYSKNLDYKHPLVTMGTPAILRDLRIITLTVSPFVYNPYRKELTVNNRITFRIYYNSSSSGENEILTGSGGFSRSFEPLYKSSVLNYNQFRNPNRRYQQRSILIVQHHSSSIVSLVNQFADWKRDKGFIVNSINTQEYSSAPAIRNYIRNAYQNWEDPPEYVVIFGGGSGPLAVPYWYAHQGPGDHPYTLMDGDDDISDLFIGRISVDSAYELATVWNKIRTYEMNPFINNDFNWHQNQLLVGDPRVSGISTINTNKYIKEIMSRRFDNYTFIEIYEGNFPTRINEALNRGANFFSFRGLELMAGWVPTIEGNYDNGAMTPNATLITCNTLDFNGGKQVEPFFRTGTPTTPRGSVSGIGMTTNYTLTSFNSCLSGGIYHGIFIDDLRTMGEALVRGKLYLWQVFGNLHPSQPPQYSQWANLIGDPSMDVWLQQPQHFNVNYESQLSPGSNSISVVVTDTNNTPLQDVWVTVRKADNSVFSTGYTDQDGEITLYFESVTEGELRLTATKKDYIPHLGRVNITGNPLIALNSMEIKDGLTPRTDVFFEITVKNYSQELKTDLEGTFYTNDEHIEIAPVNISIAALDAGETYTISDLQIAGISSGISHNHKVEFRLLLSDGINSWLSSLELEFINGYLVPVDISVTTDSENYLEPDTTGILQITIRNDGLAALADVYGTISTSSRGLTIIDSVAYFGDIGIDEAAVCDENSFSIYADIATIPGMSFDVELHIFNEAGFSQQLSLEVPLGNVTVTDPFGPDSYGYWCYDEGDTEYIDAPVYDWIEISPEKGGCGIDTGLEADYLDHQEVTHQTLPFIFRFYGIEYNEISICANGWMSFGVTEQSTHKNWRLPGALGPYAMVAAFWDNLSLKEGGVYTCYSEVDNIFIIQWDNALNIMNDAPQTFQIILYDQEHYPTVTGDGGIKIQYQVFNNVNNGTGMPSGTGNWGNYATIGIADHTCTTGLEYTFNNRYPTAALPLQHESAIFFTTGYGTPMNTENDRDNNVLPILTKLYSAYPNPFNPETSIEFSLHHQDNVSLTIYDIAGRKVNTLVDEYLPQGRHHFTWKGDNQHGNSVSSGIYFYKLQTSTYCEIKKCILLK